jgi:hypothetical protein
VERFSGDHYGNLLGADGVVIRGIDLKLYLLPTEKIGFPCFGELSVNKFVYGRRLGRQQLFQTYFVAFGKQADEQSLVFFLQIGGELLDFYPLKTPRNLNGPEIRPLGGKQGLDILKSPSDSVVQAMSELSYSWMTMSST